MLSFDGGVRRRAFTRLLVLLVRRRIEERSMEKLVSYNRGKRRGTKRNEGGKLHAKVTREASLRPDYKQRGDEPDANEDEEEASWREGTRNEAMMRDYRRGRQDPCGGWMVEWRCRESGRNRESTRCPEYDRRQKKQDLKETDTWKVCGCLLYTGGRRRLLRVRPRGRVARVLLLDALVSREDLDSGTLGSTSLSDERE